MKKINIINIEDSSYDSLLVKLELEESGMELGEFVRIQTAEELKKTLTFRDWDVVICDYYLPCFGPLSALKVINEYQLGLPMILYSGQASAEAVQKVLKAGAVTVINKDHRHFLKTTIQRVLKGKIGKAENNSFSNIKSIFDEISLHTDSATLGAWEWDIIQDQLIWNEQMFSIYGVDKKQFLHDYVSWQKLIHPEDLSITERTLQYSLRFKKIFSTEYRIIRPDGQVRYIKSCGLAQWDSAGVPVRMAGISEDITQVRKIENDLYLNSLILNEDPSAILVTNAEGTILKVNQHFCEITGYQEDEVMDKNARILSSGKHDKSFYRKMWQTVLTKGVWRGTIWNRRKNGEIFQQLLSITAIQNQYDNTIFYLGSFFELNYAEHVRNKQLIEFDLLTGLPSRQALKQSLNQVMDDLKAETHIAALLYIDLDRFQTVNDVFGCSAGDKLLKVIGNRIQEELRSTDIASRIGGDEFVVLLNHLDMSVEKALGVVKNLSENIKRSIANPVQIDENMIHVTCSMGAILHPGGDLTSDNMLNFAKNALHQAKETRDTIQFFSAGMKASLQHKINIEHALHNAVNNEELSLYYQAQVQNKIITGAEALIRWHSASLGLVSPADFIPLAENTGLIISIGQWVLEEACRNIKEWEQVGKFNQTFCSVSINVSTLQFRSKGYAEKVINTIENAQINPKHLKLELTESVLIETNEEDLETFERLKQMGIKFAIDDFGTGYCSFNYLYKLPLDVIKIDQSFVSNICSNPKELGIVKAIIAMAQTLEIDIIAEGVESSEQAALLNEAGCTIHQGYLYNRPVPVRDFSDLLLKWQGDVKT